MNFKGMNAKGQLIYTNDSTTNYVDNTGIPSAIFQTKQQIEYVQLGPNRPDQSLNLYNYTLFPFQGEAFPNDSVSIKYRCDFYEAEDRIVVKITGIYKYSFTYNERLVGHIVTRYEGQPAPQTIPIIDNLKPFITVMYSNAANTSSTTQIPLFESLSGAPYVILNTNKGYPTTLQNVGSADWTAAGQKYMQTYLTCGDLTLDSRLSKIEGQVTSKFISR